MAYHLVTFLDFDGNPITGLLPEFTLFKSLVTTEDEAAPAIEELEQGMYRFQYEPFQSYYFVIDGGAGVADNRIRWIRGLLEPNQSVAASILDEVLCHLRNDMIFEKIGNDTFMVLKKDGVPFRKWKITDQKHRAVDWPDTSRLPVNRQRTL